MRTIRSKGMVVLVGLGLGLSGCAMVGPNYKPPTVKEPAAWHGAMAAGLSAKSPERQTLAHWWSVLHDPLLSELEEKAVRGNLDLRVALARVREARALQGVSRTALYPGLSANGSAVKARSSGNSGIGRESELYDASLDAGWELDIFGGRRRAVEAATARLQAEEDGTRQVLVSLTGEVASNYVQLRTVQARLAAARDTLKILKRSHDLNLARFNAGLADELAVAQSKSLLEQSRARIPQLEAAEAAAANRIAVLLGDNPGALAKELEAIRPLPMVPPTVAVGVPAEALRRRPDIRQAERHLAAATANIGVAVADLYPKFQLVGSIGLESLHLEDLPEWMSRTFRIGPAVSWKLFDAGAVRRNIEAAEARRDQAEARYQKTVLAALEEVENALVAFVKDQDRLHSLQAAKDATKKAVKLAENRYQAGITDYISVLDAQRSLVTVEDNEVQAEGAVVSDLVRLYKALGGGWEKEISSSDKKR